MIADVSAAGGTVVFRGFLPDGSKSFMAQLQKLVSTQQSALSSRSTPALPRFRDRGRARLCRAAQFLPALRHA
jgi:hypothetical protein